MLGAATLLAGCDPTCRGPGCEDTWSTARVAIHRGVDDLALGTVDAWDDAGGGLDGDDEAGAEWWVAPFAGGILLGQPDADRVVLDSDRSTTGPSSPAGIVRGAANSRFGASVATVALQGEVAAIVGAPDDTFGRGAVYVVRQAGSWTGDRDATEAEVLSRGSSPGDRLGTRITTCADVTGDGIRDLAISIPWFTMPDDPDWPYPDAVVPPLAGALWLLSSEDVVAALDASAPMPPWELGRLWWGTEDGEGAGTAVACDRDLSGDGIADIVVGSPWGLGSTGRVTLHLGGPTLPDDGPLEDGAARVLEGPDDGGWFGIALTTVRIGDPTTALVVVGSAGAVGGAGRVHAYPAESEFANPDRLIPRRRATFVAPEGRSLPDHFGRWLSAGDLDADGQDDLVIGAPDYKLGKDAFDAGRTWVFPGATSPDWDLSTAAEDATWVIEGSHAFERVGRAPQVFDLDGDGFEDLMLPIRAAADP